MSIPMKTMNAIGSYMDDEKREQVHAELAPCEPEEFLRRYLELDPEFTVLLKNEFNIVAEDLATKIVVPVNLAIKRFYRAYVTVDMHASDEEIKQAVVEMVCAEQGSSLDNDPDIEIEADDIDVWHIDRDGAWEE